ncbi:hypothetical protein ACFQE1_05820 [Halobium palmae]|uniref:Uncharacterized protein n=1 Tax=Halobium palmae TaxID=1776492 RepID=A0ABD5RY26_9EURY
MTSLRSTVRFGLAVLGLVSLAAPLAVLLPPDPLTSIPIRATLASGLCLALGASYANGTRSLKRLGAYILVMQMLSVTMLPGLVVGYATLTVLHSIPGGSALLGVVARLYALLKPVGTTALVVSRYGLAYHFVYRGGHDALFRWLPGWGRRPLQSMLSLAK